MGTYDARHVLRLWHSQRGGCARCGVRFGARPSDLGFNVDHMTPLARGGTHRPTNLQLLCPACNQSKGRRTPAEFSLYLKRLGAYRPPAGPAAPLP